MTFANGNIQPVRVEEPLPPVPFRVHLVYLQGPHFEQQGDAFLEEFANRVKGRRLTGLFLNSNSLTSAGVAQVTQLPELSELNVIEVSSKEVDDSVFDVLARIPRLQYVNFRCPKLTGRGLARLRRMTHLAMLGSTNMSVEGIAELEQIPRLDYLQIDGFRFTDQHVATFSKLKLPRFLTNNAGIDDAMLTRFAQMQSLEQLSLHNSPITDQGLPELKTLKKLTRLDLTGTKVTAAGVADLQQSLPNCKIEWDAPQP